MPHQPLLIFFEHSAAYNMYPQALHAMYMLLEESVSALTPDTTVGVVVYADKPEKMSMCRAADFNKSMLKGSASKGFANVYHALATLPSALTKLNAKGANDTNVRPTVLLCTFCGAADNPTWLSLQVDEALARCRCGVVFAESKLRTPLPRYVCATDAIFATGTKRSVEALAQFLTRIDNHHVASTSTNDTIDTPTTPARPNITSIDIYD